MTGSTPGLISIAIVTVIALAAWLVLVFHADAHPAWRRQMPSGHDMAGQAARMTTRRQAEGPDDAPRETDQSAGAMSGAGASTERAGGTARAKASAR